LAGVELEYQFGLLPFEVSELLITTFVLGIEAGGIRLETGIVSGIRLLKQKDKLGE
jgi:hypothetical protein